MEALRSFKTSFGIISDVRRYLNLAHNMPYKIRELKMNWAKETLARLNIQVEVSGAPSPFAPIILVGNHLSYVDIILLTRYVPNVSFVGKHELSQWPVFGRAAKVMDTIFVKRSKKSSRLEARKSIFEALKLKKKIVIFPSGTTKLDESQPWRHGAFEIARDAHLYIQPFRIQYSHTRKVAYIDNDFFPTHLFKLAGCKNITATIEFHEPVLVKNAALDSLYWQKWTQGLTTHTEVNREQNNEMRLAYP